MEALLRGKLEPAELVEQVRHTDMRAVVDRAWQGFKERMDGESEQVRKALLFGAVAHFSERLRLSPEQEPVALDVTRVHSAANHLYSTSGYSIWFAPVGFDYPLQLFRRQANRLCNGTTVTVTPHSPVLVDGACTVAALCTGEASQRLVFSLNLPIPGSDIEVFDRQTLARIAWFPADMQVSRFLLLLDALRRIGDPNLARVARELLYHHHPAVRWQAFEVLMECSPEQCEQYREILGSLPDSGLDAMLSDYLQRGGV
ncbi:MULTISPECIES: hypothetical protein [Pseudomonas]|uniref:hypothetical protein n=1 Tax=Pseudomonas TaxID=286 RepID=UPI00301D11A8